LSASQHHQLDLVGFYVGLDSFISGVCIAPSFVIGRIIPRLMVRIRHTGIPQLCNLSQLLINIPLVNAVDVMTIVQCDGATLQAIVERLVLYITVLLRQAIVRS